MATMRPFFTFYGGKWRATPRYPTPRYDTIIEPFAGSAGYSLRYPDRQIVLVERDPIIAATWRYLISVSPAEILALPDLAPGQTVDDLGVHQEARWLIGWWLTAGASGPRKSESSFSRGHRLAGSVGAWGMKVRQRIAAQVPQIRHWQIIEGDYTAAPDIEATWFVDPPYQQAGKHYRFGSQRINYAALGLWCYARQGQVMVCENDGAEWMPFGHFADIKSNQARTGRTVSREALWTNYGGAD